MRAAVQGPNEGQNRKEPSKVVGMLALPEDAPQVGNRVAPEKMPPWEYPASLRIPVYAHPAQKTMFC